MADQIEQPTSHFSVSIFFVVFRETLEAAVIVSVLLSFLKQSLTARPDLHKRLRYQVWGGTAAGLAISLGIGISFVLLWDHVKDAWESNEVLYEGIFCLIACFFVTVMALGMLRSGRMQEKFQRKLAAATSDAESSAIEGFLFNSRKKKYALFLVPFVTLLREGIETTLMMGGVALNENTESIPAAAATGIAAGCLVGYLINRTGNTIHLQTFFTIMTSFLFLIAAGLFSRGILSLEKNTWASLTGAPDADEGPGLAVDLRSVVWYLDCCNPKQGNLWSLAQGLVGWDNTATVGTVVGYSLYWLAVVAGIVALRFRDRRSADRHPPGDASVVGSEDTYDEGGDGVVVKAEEREGTKTAV